MHQRVTHTTWLWATRRTPLASVALAVVAFAACEREQESETVSATPGTVAAERGDTLGSGSLDGVWYGESDDGVGQRAWVFSLEHSPLRGFVYSATGGAEVCDMRADTTGRVAWNTGDAFGRVRYRFDGQHVAGELRGRIGRTSARGDTTSADLTLRRAEPSAGAAPAGAYSNMRYSEESGDLLGTDLILLPGDSLMGALTIAEGTPSKPRPLLDRRRNGDTLQFAIQQTAVDRRGAPVRRPKLLFTAILSRDTLRLRQSDAVEDQLLTRRGSVSEFLRRQPVRACP